METPIFNEMYRCLNSSTYGKSTRDDCVLLVLRRIGKIHKCVHGGKVGFCSATR